jgi:hypothetical protein
MFERECDGHEALDLSLTVVLIVASAILITL